MAETVSTFVWSANAPPECGVYVMRQDPQPDVGPHDHLFHEVALVTRGHATHATADGRAVVRAGDLIVLRPQVWHAYEATRGRFAVVNCLISPALLRRLLPLVGTAGATFDLFWRRPRAGPVAGPTVLTPSRVDRAGLTARLRDLIREQRDRGPEWQAAATGIALDVLARVARAWRAGRPPAPPALSARAETAVLRASAYLESHLDRPPSLAALAAHVGLTPAHLSRCFAARMGGGVVSYAHRLRAEEACRLLRLTDLSVTAIARRLGYEEIAYFSRRFRAHTGRSPRAYRSSAGGV